jgi:ABC-type amino acid transport substrate-binding protein
MNNPVIKVAVATISTLAIIALFLFLRETQEHYTTSDKVVTFVINPWFPYELWNEEDKKIEGATGEYVDTIFRELGYETRFVVEPSFDKALFMVASNKVDAIYTLLETKERKTSMIFSDSIITPYESSYYINKAVNPHLEGVDINKVEEQVVFGSVVGETETEITIQSKPNFIFIRTFKAYQDLMRSLDTDIIDVALLEKYNGIYEYNQYIKQNPNSTFVLSTTGNITRQDLKIAFQKSERGEILKRLFDEKNRQLKKTNILDDLFAKYVGR